MKKKYRPRLRREVILKRIEKTYPRSDEKPDEYYTRLVCVVTSAGREEDQFALELYDRLFRAVKGSIVDSLPDELIIDEEDEMSKEKVLDVTTKLTDLLKKKERRMYDSVWYINKQHRSMGTLVNTMASTSLEEGRQHKTPLPSSSINPSSSSDVKKEDRVCSYCGKSGHTLEYCFKRKNDQKDTSNDRPVTRSMTSTHGTTPEHLNY